jgi:hypothetical protein
MTQTAVSPIISVVIVTWNGKNYAMECLESLYSCGLKVPFEVLVVDNASTDGTPDAIRDSFPQVNVIETGANLGFAKGNNIGIARSRGKYICCINSDVVVYPGCIERMLALMEADEKIGMMGPKMLCADGQVGVSVTRLPTVWNTLCSALALSNLIPNSSRLSGFTGRRNSVSAAEDVEVLAGWFWMISRAALGQVGGLDERFFMFGEDLDWCYRFRKAGWRVVFCGEAESLHYGGGSSEGAPVRFYVEMRRANMQYFRKHHGLWGVGGYFVAIGIHELARIVGYSLSYCYNADRRQEAASKVQRSLSCLRWLMSGTNASAQIALK